MPRNNQLRPGRRPGRLVNCFSIIILALIVIVGLAVLITWLAIKPKKLVYTLEDASVQYYNLTSNNHLYVTLQFTIQAHNPNAKISVYYDSMEISAIFEDQTLAFDTIEPFHQPTKNVTTINEKLVARDVVLSKNIAKDLRGQRSSGKIELDVYVKARVRLKFGVWKSSHRTGKIKCSPVTVSLSSSKGFNTTYCEVDM